MHKTVFNIRHDRGRVSIDACLTREWNAVAVESIGMLKEMNPHLVIEEHYAELPECEGMKELSRAYSGMKMRRAMDSAIEGPFVLDHEEQELDDKTLINWWKSNRKNRKGLK